ncbi:MAG TPA: hypothetical protein IAA98_12775 [Candidatus Avipropionibacterium avicola]|uniref:Uncharacterized protein n=1 Tax=Candidatus Avipropionibacterium avicola TaxID=2840701 RepID=A0A9D1GZ18_9ACTN|nr:hypothetical protein [Candidatus Avipropionibacterium avicola]
MEVPQADVMAIRGFELLAVALFLFGVWYVWRSRSWVLRGGYAGAVLTIGFDWMFNTRWFFNVAYSPEFIPLFVIDGVNQPVALAMTYGFFFGIPTAILAHQRHRLDRRFGRWGWLLVFVGMGLLQPLFEIPMVKLLHAWTYYQRPEFLWGGVIWSNIWFSGMLGLGCYGGLRLALRWEGAVDPAAFSPREQAVRQFALGVAAIWVAFTAATLVQLLFWYVPVAPWAPGPRPF